MRYAEAVPPRASLPRRLRGPAAAVVAALAVSGCEVATGPGFFGDIRGDYDGFFALEWEPVRAGRGGFEDGPGHIDIERRHRAGFSGDWSWRLNGHLFRGDLERGREEFGDEVSFLLESGFGHDILEEVTGCRFVSGERFLHGFVSRGRLRAERIARLRCFFTGFGEDFVFRLSFSGRRR